MEDEDGEEEEEEGVVGSGVWVLKLYWDRWNMEALVLREGGRRPRFECVYY